MLNNAKILLELILTPHQLLFKNKTSLRILVVSAGTFPSFEPFLYVIRELFPQLANISFTLVDPAKNKTDLFMKEFNQKKIFHTEIIIYNKTLDRFLEECFHVYFDIIYFEHSDFRIFPIVLNKLSGMFRNTSELRQSLPYLHKMMQENSLIIASCLSNQEVYQLKHLLKFSLGVNPRLIQRNQKYLYSGSFSVGLAVEFKNTPSTNNFKMISEKIRHYDNYFFLSFVFSSLILLYSISHPINHTFSSLVLIIGFLQLLFYRVGQYNVILCIFLSMAFVFCLIS